MNTRHRLIINSYLNLLVTVLKTRPLLIPAIIVVIIAVISWQINLHPIEVIRENITLKGVVLSETYHLDGSSEIIVKTEYGKLLVDVADTYIPLGSEVEIHGLIYSPSGPTNPGGFDYAKYLSKQGIGYGFKLESITVVKEPHLSLRWLSLLQKYNYEFRQRVFQSFSSSLNEDDKSLVAAVFFGDKCFLSQYDTYVFRYSGCSHLLAVSGTHVTSFLMLLPFILVSFIRDKRINTAIYITFCILVGSFTGWSDSVSRAVIMAACSYSHKDRLSGMSLAVLIMVIVNPLSVLSSGFQMSFAAALGITLLASPIKSKMECFIVNDKVNSVISAYLAVQIAMVPFFTFGSTHLGVVLLLCQITCMFLAGVACVMFVPSAICSFIPIANIAVMSAVVPLRIVREICIWSANNIGLSVNVTSFGKTALLIISGWGVITVMNSSALRRIGVKVLAVMTAVAVGVSTYSMVNKPLATIVFIDVGQGDSCLVVSQGTSCLIDTGVSSCVYYDVIPVLDYYGIDNIDYLIASHWDLDHAGGVAELIRLGRVNKLIAPCSDAGEDILETFCNSNGRDINWCREYLSSIVTTISTGDTLYLNSSVYFDVLSPAFAKVGDNDESLVMKLNVGDNSVLFTGDISSSVESRMIEDGIDLNADILKVAHHGSRYSSCSEFLDEVSSDTCVISVGERNMYGHPSDEVLTRISDAGATCLRTDQSGALVFISDGRSLRYTCWGPGK